MKNYEIVAAMVLRVGQMDVRPLSWTELGEVFNVTKDVARHRLTRFKQKYNVVDSEVAVSGWNREFLRDNTPEDEKNSLAGLAKIPGDILSDKSVVINTTGKVVKLVDDKIEVSNSSAQAAPMVIASVTPVPVNDTLARIRKIVADQLGVAEDDIKTTSHFVDDLGADSLDTVELCMAIEDEFELEISDEDAERIQTVAEVETYINGRLGIVAKPVYEAPKPMTLAPSILVAPKTQIAPLQFLITPAVLVVVRDGQPLSIDKTHKNYEKIKKSLEAGEWQDVLDFIDMKNALTRYSNGRVVVENGAVTLDGDKVPGKIAQRLINCLLTENLEALEGISNFLAKCDENPDFRVVSRIYDFIAHNDLRLDKDGFILAYKVVKNNYFDKYTGTMDNSPGKLVAMKRNKVNPKDEETCSHGLHVAARKYIPQYGSTSSGDKVLLCKVNPKDFVSIPTDYNSMKARVCEYLVLKDVTENFNEKVGIEVA